MDGLTYAERLPHGDADGLLILHFIDPTALGKAIQWLAGVI